MKHYDEFTLELFAIGSDKVADQRDEFESHLKECNRCKKFYDEIVQFHELVNGEHPLLLHQPDGGNLDLIIKPQYVSKNRLTNIIDISKSFPQRTWKYVLRKPVKSVSGFAAALVFLLYILNPKSIIKDTDPDYFITNNNSKNLEIYNKSGEKLWQTNWTSQSNYNDVESTYKTYYSHIADINNDTKNEVITSMPSVVDRKKTNQIIIFNNKGEIIKKRDFGESFNAYGEHYLNEFTASGVLINTLNDRNDKEIYLNSHHHHSPNVSYRLDNELNIKGEYWHFGGLRSFFLVDIEKNGKRKIVLCGIEDISRMGSICILDPEKINGKTQSTVHPGFNLQNSTAELFYIKIPLLKDLDPLEFRPSVSCLLNEGEDILNFSWRCGRTEEDMIVLNYYFDKQMVLKDIKHADFNKPHIKRLQEAGKIRKMTDAELIKDLKNRIEYWDGKKWVKQWTRVVLNQ